MDAYDEEFAPAAEAKRKHEKRSRRKGIEEEGNDEVKAPGRRVRACKDLNISCAIIMFIAMMGLAAAALAGVKSNYFYGQAHLFEPGTAELIGTVDVTLGWRGFCVVFDPLVSSQYKASKKCTYYREGENMLNALCLQGQKVYNSTTLADTDLCDAASLNRLDIMGGFNAGIQCMILVLCVCIWLQGYSDDAKRSFWCSSVAAGAYFGGSLLVAACMELAMTVVSFRWCADLWLAESIKFVPLRGAWAYFCVMAIFMLLVLEIGCFTLMLYLGRPY